MSAETATHSRPGAKLLSVVVPLFNEEEVLPDFVRRMGSVLDDLAMPARVLLVDDGSRDGTRDAIREVVARDHRFVGVFLSRNFGHQAAISKGLELAQGDYIVFIDGDLQDPPETIPTLLARVREGADVAYAVRRARKEGASKRLAYRSFYKLLSSTASIDIPEDSGDFCCMTRPVANAILSLPETGRFVRGLRAWVGYHQVAVPYERAARQAGASKYTLRKLVSLAYDGLFSFTRLPIRVLQFLGFFASLTSLGVATGYVLWYWLSPESFPAGFATVVVSIWLLAGAQLLFLGIVAEYVVRAYEEARGRPVAIVADIVTGGDTG